MKKLFLASLVMFGFCTFATAQSAKEIEAKKAAARIETPATTAAVGPTISAAPSDARTSATNDVDAAGVVVPSAKTTTKADAKAEAVKVDANKTDLEKKQAARAATPTKAIRPASKGSN